MKDFDKTLLNLKIISQIKPNTKIRTLKEGTVDIENITKFTSLRRYFTNENREKNIEYIDSVIEDTIQKCNNITSSRIFSKTSIKDLQSSFIISKLDTEYNNQYKILQMIYEDLLLVPDSLKNLKQVYINDKKTCSKIDIIIQKVSIHTNNIQKRLEFYKIN